MSDDPARDLGLVDVEAEALVERELALEPGAAGQARIIRDLPGEIAVQSTAPGRRLLVVSERHHPGWRASVDGADCEVERVYGDYLGCVVGGGSHEVVFRFAPGSLRRGAWLSATSLAVTLVWCVLLSRERRDGATPPPPPRSPPG